MLATYSTAAFPAINEVCQTGCDESDVMSHDVDDRTNVSIVIMMLMPGEMLAQ